MNFVNCWHVKTAVFDLSTLKGLTPDLKLIKKSVLKSGYRAHFINERSEVEDTEFYKDYLNGIRHSFYIDGSGVYNIANIDLTDNEIYFEKSNLPTGFKPWIFYSWQSDYNSSRTDIKEALENAIKDINKNHNPKFEIELVESTRPEDGAKDIVQAIKDNIDRSILAVFDITNVSTVNDEEEKKEKTEPVKEADDIKVPTKKSYPNANVVFEMSYALLRKNESQIIIVKKTRKDLSDDNVPFDFNKNKYEAYSITSKMKANLIRIIKANLQSLGIIT